jgi:uncharacterized protein (TIGR03382 family)
LTPACGQAILDFVRFSRRFVAMAVVGGVSVFAACVSSLNLSTTDEETLVYTGSNPYDFGHLQVNSGATPPQMFTLTLQNPTEDDTITMVTESAGCTQFDLSGPPPLGSAGTFQVHCTTNANFGSSTTTTCTNYMFMADFRPTQGGLSVCDLAFTYHPTASTMFSTIHVMLQGTGDKLNVDIDVAPSTVPLGQVQVGNVGSASVLLKNIGSVGVDATVSPVLVGPISISPGGVTGLQPTGTAPFNVACWPTTVGMFGADFTFNATGSAGSDSATLHVDCEGIAASALNVTPSPVKFADAFLGTAPANESFAVTVSAGSATVNSVTLDSTAVGKGVSFQPTPPSNTTISPGNGLTVTLHYAATIPNIQPLGAVTVVTSLGTRTVPITGTAEPADVATNPVSLVDFGNVCTGTTPTKEIEVYAADVKDFLFKSVMPPGSPQFSVVPNVNNVLLRGNHQNSQILTVTAHPTTAGSAADTIGIVTEIPDKPQVRIDLAFTALTAGVAADTDMVHFGSLPKDMTSGGKDVMFTNCSNMGIDVTDARIEGANPNDFTIVKTTPPSGQIPNAGTRTYTIVMTPHDHGQRTATLVIEYTGGKAQVQLDGNGIAGIDPGGNTDRETYYGCSAGGAPGIAPIAFALIVLRRRRRR